MGSPRARVAAVRRFSRFYTERIKLLEEGLFASPYSLTEGRLIHELGRCGSSTPGTVAAELGIDPGYLSRVVRKLARVGLVERVRCTHDRRRVWLALTDEGRAVLARLSESSDDQARAILGSIPPADQVRVVSAMQTIEDLLSPAPREEMSPPFTLRPHRPGDIGWVIERHGELYHGSHGWGPDFEAMCADIGRRFLESYDPAFERSWIAERDAERIGAVFLVRRSKTIGQLRFLFVDPHARGLGLGARLVSECVSHARHVGYRRMTLFTVRGLHSARRLYEAEGFELAHEEPGEGWAEGSLVQRWDLVL